ncbi:MAG: DUF4386 domain-containing protein [Deltaproteobacteria bacterium]|nr:DUF4386 domain-containing protein [Deltaproteobacteria bacterium]
MTKSPRGANRKTAIIVGVLFIIGTVAASLSIVFTGPILDDPDYLLKVSANENQIIIGALLVLIMGLALAMVPVVMFPILKKHNRALALGYVVFRGALETVTSIAFVSSLLLLIPLSQEYVKAGAPDASGFQTLGTLLLEADFQINPILKIVFSLGALMFYYLLYQSKLIPRWLSGWGLIGATLHLAAGLLVMFGSLTEFPILGIFWDLPIALQEMVMAIWLIVKGFNSSAIASGSVKQK